MDVRDVYSTKYIVSVVTIICDYYVSRLMMYVRYLYIDVP